MTDVDAKRGTGETSDGYLCEHTKWSIKAGMTAILWTCIVCGLETRDDPRHDDDQVPEPSTMTGMPDEAWNARGALEEHAEQHATERPHAECEECGARDYGARQGLNHAAGCLTALGRRVLGVASDGTPPGGSEADQITGITGQQTGPDDFSAQAAAARTVVDDVAVCVCGEGELCCPASECSEQTNAGACQHCRSTECCAPGYSGIAFQLAEALEQNEAQAIIIAEFRTTRTDRAAADGLDRAFHERCAHDRLTGDCPPCMRQWIIMHWKPALDRARESNHDLRAALKICHQRTGGSVD